MIQTNLNSMQEWFFWNLVYRGPKAYNSVPGANACRLEGVGVVRCHFMRPNQWSPAQPLWGNLFLPQLHTIPCLQLWARKGVKTLADIMPSGTYSVFHATYRKFYLPAWKWFRYCQLQHLVRAQFHQPPHLQANPIKELLAQGDIDKPHFHFIWGTS